MYDMSISTIQQWTIYLHNADHEISAHYDTKANDVLERYTALDNFTFSGNS